MQFSNDEIRSAATRLKPYVNMVMKQDQSEYAQIQTAKNDVLNRYQPVFALENIQNLSADDYRSFLMFRNNQHWRSLQRMGPAQTVDMNLLRKALAILLDETKTIKERLDIILPVKGPMVPRFGAATITPILLIAFPDKYGVLNKPAEDGLRAIGLWPTFEKETSFAQKYIEVNQIYLALRDELGIDLWTLDTVWWAVILEEGQSSDDAPYETLPEEEVISAPIVQKFGLERYLQEFLRDNWDSVPEFRDWLLHEEDGDIVGFEYNTNQVGRIDLLAHHKTRNEWLVIELKRDKTSDATVGQLLRYVGWVKNNLALNIGAVKGLIIAGEADDSLRYAISALDNPNMALLAYEVEFILKPVSLKFDSNTK